MLHSLYNMFQSYIFLGTLLDGQRHCLCVPEEKRIKALNQIKFIKSKRTAMIKQIQCLTGILNSINRALVPGRVFTRRMYGKIHTVDKNRKALKQFHHVCIGKEFKSDCGIWELFLENANVSALCRPFVDSRQFIMSEELEFFTDASGKIGFGCFFNGRWMMGLWSKDFLKICEPSIEYLELYALCVAIMTWENIAELNNTRVIIFCDNQAMVAMVNNTSSSCQNCIVLLQCLS